MYQPTQFTKVNNHLYFSNDVLYTIRKENNPYTHSNYWYVYCTGRLITSTERLSDAKRIIRAIKTLLFFEVDMKKCI